MELGKLALASCLTAGVPLASSQPMKVQTEFEAMVMNCLNGPLRGFPDHTIGCLTPRTSPPNSSEASYLDSRGLRGLIQEVKGEYRLVIAKKPVKLEQSPPLNERAITLGGNPSQLPLKSPPSVGYYQIPNRSNNPTPYIIHGAGQISINGQTVYSSP